MLEDNPMLQQLKKDFKKIKEDADSNNFFIGGTDSYHKRCKYCRKEMSIDDSICPFCLEEQ